jgi:hypothetical protein
MVLLSNFSRLSFNLVVWFFLNGLIFLVPSLSWIKYPLLLNLETLIIVFLFCCIYDASHWKPWKNDAPRGAVMNNFGTFLLRFGTLAILWSLEIILQRLVFSTVFTTTVHYIDQSHLIQDEDENAGHNMPLACMDGTIPFSIRQMAIIIIFIGTVILERQNTFEVRYLLKTSLPVLLICAGAFLAVWNNQTHNTKVGHVFLALGWIILRSSRLIVTKWVQNGHMQRITATRLLRLLLPMMIAILLPAFMIIELPELCGKDGIIPNGGGISDIDWIQMVIDHIGRVLVYSFLLFSSVSLLLNGGNSVDYTSWVMLREVVWNTACSYTVSAGELTAHIIGAHQIIGLAMFLFGWVAYIILFSTRFLQRLREKSVNPVQMIDFTKMKEYDLKVPNDFLTRVFETQKHSDSGEDE